MKCTIILAGFQRFDTGTKSTTLSTLKPVTLAEDINNLILFKNYKLEQNKLLLIQFYQSTLVLIKSKTLPV